MTNQLYVAFVLNTHDPNDFIVINVTRKLHAICDLSLELSFRHIRFVPTVRRDHSLVSNRGIVNDNENVVEVFLSSFSNHTSTFFKENRMNDGGRRGHREEI